MNGKEWTKEELEYLIKEYPNTKNIDLAKKLNRTYNSLTGKAYCLKLKKSKEYLQSELSGRNNVINNHKTRFKKGHKPFNKGKKGKEYLSTEAKSKKGKTRFKKGNVPENHRPLFSERITKEGYVIIKVEEPNKWQLKHRYIFEKEHGKIPKGMLLKFKDGNKQNITLDNLYLVSKKKNMAANTIHRYPTELKQTIRLTNKILKQL